MNTMAARWNKKMKYHLFTLSGKKYKWLKTACGIDDVSYSKAKIWAIDKIRPNQYM